MFLEEKDKGEGERCGDDAWGVGDGVQARGEGGMLLVDFRRPVL